MVRIISKDNGALVDTLTDEGHVIIATEVKIEWIAGTGLVANLTCPVKYLNLDIIDKNTNIKVEYPKE